MRDGALPGELMPPYPTWPVSGFTPTLPAEAHDSTLPWRSVNVMIVLLKELLM